MNKKRVTFNGHEMFARRFNTAADLQAKAHTVKIIGIEPVTVFVHNQEQQKTAIYFEKAARPFLMGKQLAESIARALGEWEARNWLGQTIEIYPSPTPVGDQVLARKKGETLIIASRSKRVTR